MLAIALMLAAAPVYVDPYGEDKEARRAAAPEEPRAFQQLGFTGNVGAVVPVPQHGEIGVHGGLGVRYGMRPPPPDAEVYFTPAISFLLAGQYLTATRGAYPVTQPLGSQLSVPSRPTFGDVGVDVRLELTVSRHRGMLMPDFSTWISTGTAVGFDGRRVFPTAHVGFGLGINFVREVGPWLAGGFKGWGGGWGGGGGFSLGGLGGGGAGVVVAIVLIPIIIIGAIVAFCVGSTLGSMANLELRYTMLPSDKGIGGYGGLVIGFGI